MPVRFLQMFDSRAQNRVYLFKSVLYCSVFLLWGDDSGRVNTVCKQNILFLVFETKDKWSRVVYAHSIVYLITIFIQMCISSGLSSEQYLCSSEVSLSPFLSQLLILITYTCRPLLTHAQPFSSAKYKKNYERWNESCIFRTSKSSK